jgi:hypothetical protein
MFAGSAAVLLIAAGLWVIEKLKRIASQKQRQILPG